MQIDVQNKSRSLLGISDLTLTAPIKRGLIPALDSRSYESRLRLLLRTLNTLRVSSREAEPTPLISDTVDRIRAIHSFRLAIVGDDPVKQLVLAVTFDGGREPYMRRIWRDLGPLLDVIFCNCEGYLTSHDHGFAEYMGWVRRAQVSTEFFYNASPLTVSDIHYLRETAHCRLGQARPRTTGDPIEQALSALTPLYRLTDMYPPKMAGLPSLLELDDGAILLRATHHLLSDLPEVAALAAKRPNELQAKGRSPVEIAALRWFTTREAERPSAPQRKALDTSKAQGGIINAYENLVYGCLLLIEFENAAAVKALIEASMSAAGRATGSAGLPFTNVSFTFQGLKIAEVPPGTLEQLPFEFREGMAARAGILGDLRYNHPSNWTLPERNWPPPPHDKPKRVELTSVHAVVQLTCRHTRSMEWKELVGTDDHPLASAVHAFEASLANKGVRILSVQAMQRFVEDSEPHSRDHFGFVDGLSQPSVDAPIEEDRFCDRVLAGDLLLGYENSLGDKALTGRLWDDSTFLVVRKLKQDVKALNEALNKVNAEVAKAKMMGRWPDGRNLIDENTENGFKYGGDVDGDKCPLQSHIRRANPRETRPDMKTLPRIMRRGMSYGPRYDKDKDKDDREAERGIVFMAYCASIAEQFEVIQSWLSGGNSSGPHSYSGLRDPFLGVPQDGDPNTFAFHDGKTEVCIALPSERPFVQLQWGAYLFVPSKRGLEELKQIAGEAENRDSSKKEDQRKIERTVLAARGAAVIAKLRYLDQTMGPEAARTQWKIVLEDVSARMSGMSQAVWAAIREFHQGALRTPYGVLVCSKDLVMQVFKDRSSYYTITGYAKRMDKSFGNIYLGTDAGTTYDAQATAPNDAINKVTEEEAFQSALKCTESTIERLVGTRKEVTIDVKDIVDGVLASVSAEWFGLPDEAFVESGGWHWRSAGPPTCPGHFHSPSRYLFQPNPGTETAQAGQHHGKLLREAVDQFVAQHRRNNTKPNGGLGRALFEAFPRDPADQEGLLARTLIGVMMGFLPTVDGNLRGLLYEWVYDRSLWDHEIAFFADREMVSLEKARKVLLPPLRRTLQLRPVPELVWRVATKAHRLGSVDVVEGDLVVVGIVSAMHESLINDDEDLYPLFGGDRDEDPHPTHACPGYKMALGVMLGTLAGLLESARFSPTMSPMALRISRR